MISFPNAKLNLGLRIVGKLPNGYHKLETVFIPIALCDVLEILPLPPQFSLASSPERQGTLLPSGDFFIERGLVTGADVSSNTVVRTVNLLRSEGVQIPPLYIDLYKVIPFGAGLGGGSADASFTLQMLVTMFNLSLSKDYKKQLLARIGADCPFFLFNKPLLAVGVGDQFLPVSLPSKVLHSYVTLIKPPFGISTGEAYSSVALHPEVEGDLMRIVARSPEKWNELLLNDFEDSLSLSYPILLRLKQYLYAQGAYFALLSGSGSTVYALSNQPLVINKQNPLLNGCFIWQGQLLNGKQKNE